MGARLSSRRPPVAMSIAGSDSGGGAGIVADCATFRALGAWPTVAITAVTAQNTLGVQAVHLVSPEVVRAQITSVVSDIGVDAAKTGMLADADTVVAVAATLAEVGIEALVVDPVMVATSGARLSGADAVAALMELLVPMATVLTPNLAEAAALTGLVVEDRRGMSRAAAALMEAGARAVLVKGGHLAETETSSDLLVEEGGSRWLEAPRHGVAGTHGSGCVLAAAVCAGLAWGLAPGEACDRAKRFVSDAVAGAVAIGVGGQAAVRPGAVGPRSGPIG